MALRLSITCCRRRSGFCVIIVIISTRLAFVFSVNCNRVWTSVVLNYCVEDKWCVFLRGLQRPGTDVVWGFRSVISGIEEAVFLSGVGHDEGG